MNYEYLFCTIFVSSTCRCGFIVSRMKYQLIMNVCATSCWVQLLYDCSSKREETTFPTSAKGGLNRVESESLCTTTEVEYM